MDEIQKERTPTHAIELQDLNMTYPNGKQALQHLNLALKAPA